MDCLTLASKDDRELGLSVSGLLRVAVGATAGDLQGAHALATVGLGANEPDALLTCFCICLSVALSQVERDLVC